jgi:hypothetical protein
MPTNERSTQDIGHCRRCKMQWVVKDGAKGKNSSTHKGQVCPDCRSADVYYEKEDNR